MTRCIIFFAALLLATQAHADSCDDAFKAERLSLRKSISRLSALARQGKSEGCEKLRVVYEIAVEDQANMQAIFSACSPERIEALKCPPECVAKEVAKAKRAVDACKK